MASSTTFLKTIFYSCIVLILNNSYAQDTTSATKSAYVAPKLYKIIKNDATEYIGEILEDNNREILLNSSSIGKLYIPKHEIKSITPVEKSENTSNQKERMFASKYFFTSSALPLKKGENVVNIYGGATDLKFGLTDNISASVTTTFAFTPVIASLKYTQSISKNVHVALGVSGGAVFLFYDEGGIYGIAPFGILTIGNEKTNISLTGASLSIKNQYYATETIGLYSVGLKLGITDRFSLIADSFIYFDDNQFDRNSVGVLAFTGFRIRGKKGAFQTGLGQFYADGGNDFIPLPVIGWTFAL